MALAKHPLKGIPKAYRKPIGAMVTGRGYGYRPGPEITRGYISGRPGPKYYFPNQFFALIPNFLSGGRQGPRNRHLLPFF